MKLFRRKKITRKILAVTPHWLLTLILSTLFRRRKEEYTRFRNKEFIPNHYSLQPFNQTQTLFVHIPKAAGISVNQALYGCYGGGHKTIFEYRLYYSKRELKSLYKFSIVRNPWARLVSAYHFLLEGGLNEQDKEWSKENLTKYSSFDEFVVDWINDKNIYSFNHFVPQVDYLFHNSRSFVDDIFKLEELNINWHLIEKKFGRDIKLPHLNSNSISSNYREYYTEKSKEIVSKVYKADINKFGYKF